MARRTRLPVGGSPLICDAGRTIEVAHDLGGGPGGALALAFGWCRAACIVLT